MKFLWAKSLINELTLLILIVTILSVSLEVSTTTWLLPPQNPIPSTSLTLGSPFQRQHPHNHFWYMAKIHSSTFTYVCISLSSMFLYDLERSGPSQRTYLRVDAWAIPNKSTALFLFLKVFALLLLTCKGIYDISSLFGIDQYWAQRQ